MSPHVLGLDLGLATAGARTHLVGVNHGTSWTYANNGCRCQRCTEAHSARTARRRRAAWAAREVIDGRLTAPGRTHGKPATYTNYGCRCVTCTAAYVAYGRTYRTRAAA